MEKPHRMAQVYGYIVCLVSVITFIICLANIIPAMIDRGDPMHAGSMFGMQNSPSLASFENYKMDILKTMSKEGEGQSFMPDDQTLRAMYEAAKDERIQNVLHSSNRTIMVSGIILVVSVLLFFTHWIWMRKLAKQVVSN